jgi:VWA domain-containing protein
MLALALAAAGQQAPPLPDQLVIAAVVTDKKGHAVTDLKPEEIEVQENGQARPTVRAEHDTRPLRVALVLDTSAAMGSNYASDVIPAAMTFLKKLPQGSVFSVWSTSDHSKRIVDEGTDLKTTEDKLRNLAPFGDNAAIHTMVEASQEAGAAEDHHSAVVLVSSASMDNVTVDLQSLLPKASLKPTYVGIEVVLNSADQDARLQDGLKLLTSRTAGFHERVFSTMSIAAQLDRVNDILASQYRVAWKPGADPRQTHIEVKVKRPNTRVVQAQRISTAW